MSRLRFGTFLAPFHPAGVNPTAAIHRDLRLIEHLDELGFDEAWIGEHHSAGTEIIASPEIFMAAAAERTKNIKLGTGVVSVSYHNPLWATERIVLLDHLTRGRVMFGLGPGSLPTDSAMIGLNPTDTRELLEVNLDIIMRLLRGEAVTAQTKTHNLVDARLHLRAVLGHRRRGGRGGLAHRVRGWPGGTASACCPSAPPSPPRASTRSPTTGTSWRSGRRRYGTTVDRSKWRLVSTFHIAETREQAYRDVEFGIENWFRYFQKTAAFPQMAVEGGDLKEMIDFINEAGIGAIGTVEDAERQVQKLVDQSGGFGCMLVLGTRVGQPAGHLAVVGAARRARAAEVPGPGPAHAGRQGAGRRDAFRAHRGPARGHRAHDREVPEGAGREDG